MFSSDIRNQTAVNVTIFGKPFDYVVRVVSHEMDHYWFWETGVWDPNDGVCYTEECQAMTEFLAEKTEDMCVELVSELPSDTPIE